MACKACAEDKYNRILRIHYYWMQTHIRVSYLKKGLDIKEQKLNDLLKIMNEKCDQCPRKNNSDQHT